METSISNQKINSVWMLLRYTYGIIPIVAGFDKFADLLVNWDKYLAPGIGSILPFSPHTFMEIVGIIEIIAGIIVLAKPMIGAYIVSAWLVCIAFNLIATGTYFDIAVRDLAMAIGAFSLGQLSHLMQPQPISKPGVKVEKKEEPSYAAK